MEVSSKTEVGLSTSEAEVLRRLAGGETVEEIADSWGTSGRWVRYQLTRARDRLGAVTSEHAVALFVLQAHPGMRTNGHAPAPYVPGAAEERVRKQARR